MYRFTVQKGGRVYRFTVRGVYRFTVENFSRSQVFPQPKGVPCAYLKDSDPMGFGGLKSPCAEGVFGSPFEGGYSSFGLKLTAGLLEGKTTKPPVASSSFNPG